MSGTNWRKSSYSFSNQNCVEVGHGDSVIAVRDSQDPDGPILRFPGSTWGRLLRDLKADS